MDKSKQSRGKEKKKTINAQEFTLPHSSVDKPKRLIRETKESMPECQFNMDASSSSSSSHHFTTLPRTLPPVKRYKMRPIVPARKAELIPVAKAMHQHDFESRLCTLFQSEKEAALESIESGVYIGWRCEEYTWDCIRLGRYSRCFCDHILDEHAHYNGKSVKVKCRVLNCSCKAFSFIPERPQDIGEWWLQKRPGFEVSKWRAKCKCKHAHVEHDAQTKMCSVRGCCCFTFKSNFLCAACDRHWEDHWTFFDTLASRKEKGLPVGDEFLPFHEMTELRDALHGDREPVNAPKGRIENADSRSQKR